MKKYTYFFCLITAGLMLLSSCENELLEGEFFSTPDGSDPEEFCAEAPFAIANAQAALANGTTEQQADLCAALLATINTTIEVCGDDTGVYQALLDSLGSNCMIDPDDGGDDDDPMDSLVGETYLLTAFEVETAIDLDGDGVPSTELIGETGCYLNETIFFDTETELTATSTSFLELFVEVDGDVVTQMIDCIEEEEITNSSYVLDGTTITIDGIVGVVSSTQIIFTVPDGFFGEIVSDDGMGTVELLEDITFTYTLQ